MADSLLRRRPASGVSPPLLEAHDRTSPAAFGGKEGFEDGESDEELPPTRTQEYASVVSDFVFWVVVVYCAAALLAWVGEQTGLVNPHFEAWSPARWWHADPQSLQDDLYANASSESDFAELRRVVEDGLGGWVSPKLVLNDYLGERGRYERRLEVTGTVGVGEALVTLPLSRVLTAANLSALGAASEVVKSVVDAHTSAGVPVAITEWAWLALYMAARSNRTDMTSDGHPLGGTLRREHVDAALAYNPLFWGDADLEWLNGTDLLRVTMMEVHAGIEGEFYKIQQMVPAIAETVPIVEFKKWAMIAMSRSETVQLPDPDRPGQTVPRLAMLPIVDLADHHLPVPEKALETLADMERLQQVGSRSNVSYNSSLGAVVLEARVPMVAGDAVTVGYGVRSNSDYLVYHGLVMPTAWTDATLCVQHAQVELPLPAESPPWLSRHLLQPYRFAVPACPSRRLTPHVAVGAARFLVAAEEDVLTFEDRLAREPGLLEVAPVPKQDGFLQHGVFGAISKVCNVTALPPSCPSPLSLRSERAAWDLIMNQTFARLSSYAQPTSEDDRLLAVDEGSPPGGPGLLTVNQRHAVIVRREEKLALERWCASAAAASAELAAPPDAVEDLLRMEVVEDGAALGGEEPKLQPAYWASLSLHAGAQASGAGHPKLPIPEKCVANR